MRLRPIPSTLSTLLLAIGYGYLAYFLFENSHTSEYLNLEALSWSFIMLIPYTLGVIVVYLAKERFQASLLYAIFMPWVACIGVAGVVIALSLGMLLCLVISVPILFPAASFGGLNVWLIRKHQRAMAALLLFALLAPYGGGSVEAQFNTPQQTVRTHSSIIIESDADTVWHLIKQVEPISPSTDTFSWQQLLGIPKPLYSTLSLEGVGGIRQGHFENGLRFDEVVTNWEYPHIMRFTVEASSETLLPPPLDMVDGEYFDLTSAMYEIEPLENGKVRLHLSSEHVLKTRFNRLGAFWTDLILHDFQSNLLEVIKTRAETVNSSQ